MKNQMRSTEFFSNVNGVITIGFYLGFNLIQVTTTRNQDVADRLINFFHDYKFKDKVS
ncbi:hypothetical protein [Halobacillus litoralis]|uniref:hypothetical protein n=1 Tax=Halobacillus litoralis TaxID=45668 RepID=UPI001CD44BB4|nr:hypothetical protein [Halobacillus litoralis]MCA1021479.1 hypothetical protein [Halobacillus litoralis]